MEITDLDAGTTRIVVDVDANEQPIRGHLGLDTGQPEPFTGWLELTRALERLISEAAQSQAPPPSLRAP
jgi:hypothetical protein